MTAASPLFHCTIRRITRTCNTACYDGLCTGNAYRFYTAAIRMFQTARASRVSYVQSFTSPLWISYPPCKQYGKCNFVIPRPPVTHIHAHDNADSEYHDNACNQFQNAHLVCLNPAFLFTLVIAIFHRVTPIRMQRAILYSARLYFASHIAATVHTFSAYRRQQIRCAYLLCHAINLPFSQPFPALYRRRKLSVTQSYP